MLHDQAKQYKAKTDFDRAMQDEYGDYEPHASKTAAEREEEREAGIAELIDCHRDCDAPCTVAAVMESPAFQAR
jgi:hypothetical protein